MMKDCELERYFSEVSSCRNIPGTRSKQRSYVGIGLSQILLHHSLLNFLFASFHRNGQMLRHDAALLLSS